MGKLSRDTTFPTQLSSVPTLIGLVRHCSEHPPFLVLMAQQPQQPPMAQMLPPDATEDGQAAQYYQQETGDLTGGLPINLDSLRDGPPGSKPFYPYSTLIRYAIKGSPNQKLLLEDIYYAIESRFPYFRNAPNGWKNSVRHNLSLNPCFEKVPRPLTDRGKGSYWTVNDHVDPRTGVHRIRKKRGKKVNRLPSDEEGDIDYHPPEAFDEAAATTQFVSNQQQLHPDPAAQDLSQFQPNPAQFDPLAYPIMPRFSPFPIHISPEEGLELDEHGNIDWRLAWLKELGHLQHLTTEQDKAGADQDWYRMMMFRVRSAMLAPINPAEMVIGPPPIPSQQPNMAVGEVQDPQRQ